MPKIIFQPLMIANPAVRLAESDEENNTEFLNLNKHKL